MGNGISWFQFTSRKEQRNKEKRYYKKMFPLGEKQRDRELDVFRQFSVLRDMKEQDLMYQLLCLKECLSQEEEERAEAVRVWRGSILAKRMTREMQNILIALAELEADCESLEEFPTVEEIAARAKTIEAW